MRRRVESVFDPFTEHVGGCDEGTTAGSDDRDLPHGCPLLKAQETPRVDAREKVQKEPIKEGVQSGELTRHETKRLVREQKTIQKMENKAKSDGVLTLQERVRLKQAENKARRDIARQKRDAQEKK